MLFSARTTLQLLVAVSVGLTAHGYSYDEDYMLAARDLGLDYGSLSARDYADEGDFVLSRRDLARLGVRSDDISHVLVVRMHTDKPGEDKHAYGSDGGKLSQVQADSLRAQLAKHERKLVGVTQTHANHLANGNHERAKEAKEIMDYHKDEIHSSKELLRKGGH